MTAPHDYIKPWFDDYCTVINAERIIDRINMIEKTANMICIIRIRLFACRSLALLLSDFLPAIFHFRSQFQMFVKGRCHGLFKFFDGYRLHRIGIRTQCQSLIHDHIGCL